MPDTQETTSTVLTPLVVGRGSIEAAKTTFLVSPSMLTIDFGRNGRFGEPSRKKIKEYAQSFAAQGQLQPIRAKNIEGALVVTYGFHRALAGLHGIETGILPADWKIRYELDETETDQDSYLQNITENRQHEKLTVMDEAAIYSRLTKPVEDGGFAMSVVEASTVMGKKPRFGNAVAHLLSLPKTFQLAIHAGKVSGELGYEVAMAGEFGQAVLVKMLAKQDKVLQTDWRESMREAKSAAKPGAEVYNQTDGGLGGDPAEAGDVEVQTGRKKKKVKKSAEDRTPKRTMKEVNAIYTGVIEAAKVEGATVQHANGAAVAKRLLAINLGKGTAAAAAKYITSLTVGVE